MVAKRSEYQNQFKSSVVKKHNDIYEENLALRHTRRDREFMHTPLCWTEIGTAEDSPPSDSSEEEIQPRRKPRPESTQDDAVYQSLAEIMAESKRKSELLRTQRMFGRNKPVDVPSLERMSLEEVGSFENEDSNKKNEEKILADKSISINELVDQENRKLNQKIAQRYAMENDQELFLNFASDTEEPEKGNIEEKKISDLKEKDSNLRKRMLNKKRSHEKPAPIPGKTNSAAKGNYRAVVKRTHPSGDLVVSKGSQASKRPERPDRRKQTSTVKRPTSAGPTSTQQSKPPFVAYGAADVEDTLALHRTHNVLCPNNVYKQALRAKKLREEEQRRHHERMKALQLRASTGDLLDKLNAASLTPRDSWASEYSLQFHGYAPSEYQRAVSARSVCPRVSSSLPTQPFRTGGCKVVHVD